MKNREDIIRRAICLICYTDRCFLEDTVFDGIRRSLKEREDQRQIIIKWLKEKKYYDYLTQSEKQIVETPVVKQTNNRVRSFANDFECIEPLIWCLGLIDHLSDYNNFVLDNLHFPLQIGPMHTLESLSKCCRCVSVDTLNIHREIATLWYWRCLEARSNYSKSVNYTEAIKNVFGESELNCLNGYKAFNFDKGDFFVRSKRVANLSETELVRLEVIAERRFYAFEWLCSDENWGEIDLVC